jgi:hypothetical protein
MWPRLHFWLSRVGSVVLSPVPADGVLLGSSAVPVRMC